MTLFINLMTKIPTCVPQFQTSVRNTHSLNYIHHKYVKSARYSGSTLLYVFKKQNVYEITK